MNKKQLIKKIGQRPKLKIISELPEHRVTEGNNIKSLYKFDSVHELMDMYNKHKGNKKLYHNLLTSESSQRYKDWCLGTLKGYNTKKAITECVENGKAHPRVMTYINKYRQELQEDGLYDVPDEMKSVKRKRKWSDDGGELDIDRVMTGDPNYWVSSNRDGKQKIVNIGINYSMSSDNASTQFPRLLAMAFCTAEIVERLGYGVEITAVRTNFKTVTRFKDWERGFTFPLKRCQEPLDINRIGSISLVGFFRFYSFFVGNVLYEDGCGMCCETTDEMTAFAGTDVIIENKWLDSGKQEYYVKKALAKIQGEV